MEHIFERIITGSLCALRCETLFGLSHIFTKTATQTTSAFALLIAPTSI